MISSRHPITFLSVHLPSLIRSAALFNQTSVPCDKPEIRTNSSKVVGLVNSRIPRTKGVPNSGIPAAPVFSVFLLVSICRLSTEEKIFIVSGSFIGIVFGSIPEIRSNSFIAVGSTCPKISNFNRLSWMSWNSKCVVFQSAKGLLAGNCTGVKSCTSNSFGTTRIPPGCWPVVRFTPSQPLASRRIWALRIWVSMPISSSYPFTYP